MHQEPNQTPAPTDTTHLNLAAVVAALPDAIDQAMRNTLPGMYTPQLAADLAAAMTAELRNPQPADCPVFPGLCTETMPDHHDHSNHEHTVTNKQGEHLLDVGFVQLSDGGPAIVYIGGMSHEDYLPEEVRPATAKLRQLLDEADAIADRLLADRTEARRG
ncbi:hypothetical protein QA802_41260 [Streptomyces sp. B21-105]|uniref:hypothetical protein n=1 Tax=Streptomyces sp. B21-105 TaxID=3039417 RepID=UPI002FEF1BCA